MGRLLLFLILMPLAGLTLFCLAAWLSRKAHSSAVRMLLYVPHVGNGLDGDAGYKDSGNPFVTYYADEIQAVMDSLAPGYALRFYDFSPYRKFSENGWGGL